MRKENKKLLMYLRRGVILQKNSDLFEKNCKKTFLAACFAV
jgi:hypothetical protein